MTRKTIDSRKPAAGETPRERLLRLTPEPPAGLRQSCLPPVAGVLNAAQARRQKEIRMRRRILFGGGGLAAAAVIVAAILNLLPGGPSVSAAAAAVRAAAENLDEAPAVSMRVRFAAVDDEAGSLEQQSMLIVADVGVRIETEAGLLVYNADRQVRWEYSPETNLLIETPYHDPIRIQTLLARASVEHSVTACRLLQPENLRGLEVRRWSAEDGTLRLLLRALDEFGWPIAAEIDETNQRLLRTESCTSGEWQVVRTIVDFGYPDRASIDLSLFQRPVLEMDPSVVIALPESAARTQALVNVRGLCTAVMLFAHEHDDRLPASIEELAPYAPGGDLNEFMTVRLADGTVGATVRYLGTAFAGRKLSELAPDSVLFEAELDNEWIRGFADGHAAADPR